jgi:hypothetical protein
MRSAILLAILIPYASIAQPILPNPMTTPGVADPNLPKEIICDPTWSTKEVRPPKAYTHGLKLQELQSPEYTDKNPSHYQQDHLIPLELGGDATDPRNEWAQSWHGNCSAHEKDQLENVLHDLVCSGMITLQDAQDEIARNWIASYQVRIGPLK